MTPGAKAVARNGIVVASAYATKAQGGGKLTESSRLAILAIIRGAAS